jgi:hypothetical protein
MIFRAVGHLIDRVFIVAFAIASAQFPIFYGQYANTLAGATAEAQARYSELERAANRVHLTIDGFIERHNSSPDPAIQESGEIHRNTVTRYKKLQAALDDVRSAPFWRKPVVVAQRWDPEIFQATAFEPGLPMTSEGLIYGFAGLLLAALLGTGTRTVYRRASGRHYVPAR